MEGTRPRDPPRCAVAIFVIIDFGRFGSIAETPEQHFGRQGHGWLNPVGSYFVSGNADASLVVSGNADASRGASLVPIVSGNADSGGMRGTHNCV